MPTVKYQRLKPEHHQDAALLPEIRLNHEHAAWLNRYLPLIKMYIFCLFIVALSVCTHVVLIVLSSNVPLKPTICVREPSILLVVVVVAFVFFSNMCGTEDSSLKGTIAAFAVMFAPLSASLINFCTDAPTAAFGLLLTLCFFITVSGVAIWIAAPLSFSYRIAACILVPITLLVFYFGQLSRIARNILSAVTHAAIAIIIWDTTWKSIYKTRVHLVLMALEHCEIMLAAYYMYVYLLTPTLWTVDPSKMFTGISQLLNVTANDTFCPDPFKCNCVTIGC
ncbi:Ba194 [Baboon cytomegalovirus]|nr:Ba194 [Baboon cytomegalovirus]